MTDVELSPFAKALLRYKDAVIQRDRAERDGDYEERREAYWREMDARQQVLRASRTAHHMERAS